MSGTDIEDVERKHRSIWTHIFATIAIIALFLGALLFASMTKAHAETDLTRDGVHVVGDSITYRAHRDVIAGPTRPRGWTVDAFPGRRITALTAAYGSGIEYPSTTRDYWYSVRHINKPPRARVSTVVIALGTNGADEVMTVNQAAQMYAHQIRTLRARNMWKAGAKNIVLVTPWKAPRIKEGAVNPFSGKPYHPYQWADKNVVYRKAIQQVARNSGHVKVMPWHAYASTHPGQFRDGVHPQLPAIKVWRNMLYRAIRSGK